ncbi:MAG: type II toxin-antitoxin system Phd/YefM family antitoxin [Alphaproteobacteria bacterium]|nr:type II toxin-antitoxin system Phd/YefM family antitoxin [Alphaproteobacteria bacterium]
MANRRATAASVQKNFGYYRDAALRRPLTVTHHGRPSVVIIAAEEYERLRRLDRQTLSVEEIGDETIAAIRKARIPKSRQYRTTDLKG